MPDRTHRFLVEVELTETVDDDPDDDPEQLRTREQILTSLAAAVEHSTAIAPEAIAEATRCSVAMEVVVVEAIVQPNWLDGFRFPTPQMRHV